MTTAGRLTIDEAGLFIKGVDASEPAILVHFDDHHIWSFLPEADGLQGRGGTSISWPEVLHPYLDGTTVVRLANLDGSIVYGEVEHRFGAGEGRVAFVDELGHRLTIDKMGHLSRSFDDTAEEIKREILEATLTVLAELKDRCGVEAYLGYGALLGAVREGGMISHDTDTDVCYFSRHDDPAHIIAETFRIERELKALGWNVLRMSGGDLKVVWRLSDGRNCHIDVFGSFFINGVLYVMGNRAGSFPLDSLVPLGTVQLDGYEFPAPRDPEAFLVFLYGEGWRVPDPAFVPHEDPEAMIRLDGWMRGFRFEMPEWTGLYTSRRMRTIPMTGSSFAAWVEERLEPGAAVLDLGAGNGRDTFFFAERGRRVRASDYSRLSIRAIRKVRVERGLRRIASRQVILNETRHVFELIARLSRDPHHIYARQLIGCLDKAARENLFRIGASVLRGGQSMWLEFSVPHVGARAPEPAGLVRRFDVDVLTSEITASGGRVDYLEIGPGVDMFDNPDPAVARMRVTWNPKNTVDGVDMKEKA